MVDVVVEVVIDVVVDVVFDVVVDVVLYVVVDVVVGVVVVDVGVFHHCGLGHFEIDKFRGRFRSLKIKRQVDLSKRSGGREH